jgi:O-succinylbenzoate synthase
MPLAHPFETSFGVTTGRRILLVELEAEGLTAWGECVAGEHPYFSDEKSTPPGSSPNTSSRPASSTPKSPPAATCPALFEQVRGHRMAKAALENAIWDLDAQQQGIPLAKLLGGTRDIIPCGVSIGIQPTPEKLMDVIAKELAAGYQRIKLKCKPGWDTKIFAMVRDAGPTSSSAATPTPPTASTTPTTSPPGTSSICS